MSDATLHQEVQISASPAQVYRALTDPHQHAAFTGSPATGEPIVDGPFTAWDGYIEGTFVELVPDQRIVWSWSTSQWPSDAPASRVELTLATHEAGTQLTMVHSQVPAEQAEDYRQGWIDYYWEPLKHYFDGPDLTRMLTEVESIAVVGISDKAEKAGHYVPAYLQQQGYRIFGVSPTLREVLGLPVFSTLARLPERPDLVLLFRRSDDIPGHLDDILTSSPRAVWMQLGIRHEEVAQRLRQEGIEVVQDSCLMVEHRRLGIPQKGANRRQSLDS